MAYRRVNPSKVRCLEATCELIRRYSQERRTRILATSLRVLRPLLQARSHLQTYPVDKALIPMTSKLFRFRLPTTLFVADRNDSTYSVRCVTGKQDMATA